MTVAELIEQLKLMPPDLDACVWVEAEDEYLPVVQVVFEDGSSTVDLETTLREMADVEPGDAS